MSTHLNKQNSSSINSLTSFIAGFVIFSVLGYMANIQVINVGNERKHDNMHRLQIIMFLLKYFQGLKVEDVGMEGEGLVFIVYRWKKRNFPLFSIALIFCLATRLPRCLSRSSGRSSSSSCSSPSDWTG